MSLDMNDPLDVLYLELIPHRITPPDVDACRYGPSALLADLELQRALWALAGEAETDTRGAA